MKNAKTMRGLAALVALVLMLPSLAFAQDAYIDWDGTGDFPASGNVRLTSDPSVKNAIIITGNVTLDLNGHTLTHQSNRKTSSQLFTVENGGSLVVEDSSGGSGKIVQSYSKNDTQMIYVKEGGSFTLNSGCLERTNSGSLSIGSILYLENGSATINGGKLNYAYGSGNSLYSVQATGEKSSFTMTGGEITTGNTVSTTAGVYLTEGAKGSITGGEVNAQSSLEKGVVFVTDGAELELSGNAVVRSNARNTRAVFVGGSGKMVLSDDALVESTAFYGTAMYLNTSDSVTTPTLEMRGGTVRNKGDSGKAMKIDRSNGPYKGGVVTITGGIIENTNTSNSYAVDVQGTLNMEGGVIRQANAGIVAISNAEVSKTPPSESRSVVNIRDGEVDTESAVLDETIRGQASAQLSVTGGLFNKAIADSVKDSSVVVTYEDAGRGETMYAVGSAAKEAAQNARAGDVIEVLKGSGELTTADQVIVKNSGAGQVTANGQTVPQGGAVEVHTRKWIVTKQATATQAGEERLVCTECDKVFEIRAIPATGTPSLPKTGDSTPLALYFALMMMAGAGIAACLLKRRWMC